MSDNKLSLAVCVAPTSGLNLDHEVSLIKPAILYGDHVKLYSPKTSLLSGLTEYSELNSLEQLLNLIQMAEPLGLEVDMSQLNVVLLAYRTLKQLPRLTKAQESTLSKMENLLESPALDKVRRHFDNLAEDTGIRNLDNLLKATDLLDVHRYNSPDSILNDWLGSVITSTIIGSETLILDATTSKLMNALEGLLLKPSNRAAAMTKATVVAGKLFERLPTFSEASLNEILDIRKELDAHIVPFRAAIIKLADDISSQQWDEGFELELESLAREYIDQPVHEIEEICRTSTGLKRILEASAAHTSWTKILGCMVSDIVDLPSLLIQFFGIGGISGIPATAVGILTSAVKSVPHARQALLDWKREKKQVPSNRLYFYHQLKKKLE